MAFDMYLDPSYTELIIEVNKLKKEVAEKIVEKNWIMIFVLPEIKHSYNLKLGVSESELFLAKLNLDKLKRKVSLYNEALKYENDVDENKIDKLIAKEFKNQNYEYTLMKREIQDAIEFTHKDKKSKKYIENLNYIYTELTQRLNPLLNSKNSILENQLFDILEDSYKNCDLSKMLGLKALCDENHINEDLELDDLDGMKNLKKIYDKLLEETQSLILNIRSSEMFSNRTFLNNEILLRRKKDNINDEIDEISKEYTKFLKELDKLMKKM